MFFFYLSNFFHLYFISSLIFIIFLRALFVALIKIFLNVKLHDFYDSILYIQDILIHDFYIHSINIQELIFNPHVNLYNYNLNNLSLSFL